MSFLFFNCKKEEKSANSIAPEITIDTTITVADAKAKENHNSQNSLDWAGVYKGVTPCADCEGINTEITLNKNLTYTFKTSYLGKGKAEVYEENGAFTWNETGSIIVFSGLKNRPNQYKVGENKLTQLDMEGQEIEGVLAEKYILKK